MIEEPARLRIARAPRRPDPAQVAALARFPAAVLVDAMFGDGAMEHAVAPLPGQEGRVCGPALVAGQGPGDILATLACVRMARPGDVVVAAAQGHRGCAAAGDRALGLLRNAGAAGFVTDGCLRDLEGLRAVGLPAWCTGLTPASPVVRGPGTVGLPAMVGGQRVAQGDVIVADADGVVVVPWDRLDAVAEAAARVMDAEAALDARVADGLAEVDAVEAMVAAGEVEWV